MFTDGGPTCQRRMRPNWGQVWWSRGLSAYWAVVSSKPCGSSVPLAPPSVQTGHYIPVSGDFQSVWAGTVPTPALTYTSGGSVVPMSVSGWVGNSAGGPPVFPPAYCFTAPAPPLWPFFGAIGAIGGHGGGVCPFPAHLWWLPPTRGRSAGFGGRGSIAVPCGLARSRGPAYICCFGFAAVQPFLPRLADPGGTFPGWVEGSGWTCHGAGFEGLFVSHYGAFRGCGPPSGVVRGVPRDGFGSGRPITGYSRARCRS